MQFDLVTPEKLLLSKEASHVIAPGEEGSFGAMDGHQPLISTLKPGALKVMNGEEETVYYVSYGFVDVTPEKITVLAEEAMAAESIDVAKAEAELAAVDHELKQLKKTHEDDSKTAALQQKLECLRAKIAVAKN